MQEAPEIRVGAAQIGVDRGSVAANLERHIDWVARGRNAGLDLLVFPELSLTGYRLGDSVPAVAMFRDDPRLTRLAEAADAMQVVAGFVEEAGPGEYYNALAIVQGGECVAVHRKLNLPTYGSLEEGKLYGRGDSLTVAELNGHWRASYLICADLWNPALVHAALLDRPHVMVAPINSASGAVSEVFSNEANWIVNVTFYAMTYGTPVIMANRYGEEDGLSFWGGSRILGPRGETLASAESDERLVTATLTRAAIARARFELPTHRDANPALIRALLDRHSK